MGKKFLPVANKHRMLKERLIKRAAEAMLEQEMAAYTARIRGVVEACSPAATSRPESVEGDEEEQMSANKEAIHDEQPGSRIDGEAPSTIQAPSSETAAIESRTDKVPASRASKQGSLAAARSVAASSVKSLKSNLKSSNA